MKTDIVGYGAIGSKIAVAVQEKVMPGYSFAALYDANDKRVFKLVSRLGTSVVFKELDDPIEASDLVLEAT